MLTVDQLVQNLARAEVTEIALSSGRLPCVKIDGEYKPVDDMARSADAILNILMKLGGSRYLEDLGEKAVQWTTRVEGVGTVAVSAVDRKGNVQARMMLVKRDESEPRISVARKAPPPPPRASFGELELELESDIRPT